MDQVADVDIEADGVYKYILIKLSDKKSAGVSKVVVRGYSWADYHADILDRVSPKFHRLGLAYECLGGGRIDHDSASKKINIYGYSVGFGQADHKVTKEIISRHYPESEITCSNAGY